MNQYLLLKYISGKASQQEKEEVASWIDASPENLKEFMSLRKSYDAMIWQDMGNRQGSSPKTFSLRLLAKNVLRIAAVFVIAFGLGYVVLQELSKEEMQMQTVYAPAGQRTLVTLADGTTVWLNGKSTLSFPNQFSEKVRNVQLNGEAYFDVRKDTEKQFIVSTPHRSSINVLGTQFNVKAFKESEEVTTTLIEGKVSFKFTNDKQQVQSVAMNPGQKLVYNSSINKVNVYTTSGDKELSWKDGKIIFDYTPLREALAILAERYDVEFIIHKNVPNDDSFSGIFTDKSLEQILNYIKASSQVRWRYLNSGKIDKEKTKIEIY